MACTVINLFAGPGAGKSTTAAKVYALLKDRGAKVELVREYVKDWAWAKRRVSPLNQLLILGKQSDKEALLYTEVDFIVTDSPILLPPFYQQKYTGKTYLYPAASAFMEQAKEDYGVSYTNIFLKRQKQYAADGRFETEAEANEIDNEIALYLAERGRHFYPMTSEQVLKFVTTLPGVPNENFRNSI